MKKLLIVLIWFPASFFTLALALIYLQMNYNPQITLAEKLHQQTALLVKNNRELQAFEAIPEVLGAQKTVFAAEDARPALLEHFFKKYNSPLLPYAQYIVDTADKYGLEYSLIPAMAMQESEGCKKIPEGSNNCWGYGIYGTQVIKFNSYEEGINTVARTLKEKYLQDSLTNPDLIMSRWTPSSNGSWSYAVNYFMQMIRQGK